jgi:predicted RNA-binding protein Jag
LRKGLNYAVSTAVLPIEDILASVEKVIVSLPVEAAKEVPQETVRILKASGRSRDNLSGAERRALRSLRANANLTVLQADKGNATVVLNIKDYNEKVSALLSAATYR